MASSAITAGHLGSGASFSGPLRGPSMRFALDWSVDLSFASVTPSLGLTLEILSQKRGRALPCVVGRGLIVVLAGRIGESVLGAVVDFDLDDPVFRLERNLHLFDAVHRNPAVGAAVETEERRHLGELLRISHG